MIKAKKGNEKPRHTVHVTQSSSFIKMCLLWEQEMKPVTERDVITHTIKHDDSIYRNPNTHTHALPPYHLSLILPGCEEIITSAITED